MALSDPLRARLVQAFSGPGAPAEYFDASSGTSYIPQYGTFATPDGRIVAGGPDVFDNGEFLRRSLTGFAAYEFDPTIADGRDNAALNGAPYEIFSADGQSLYTDVFRGLSAKWDTLNVLAPLAMMVPAMAATAIGVAGAAAAAAAPASGGVVGLGDAGLMYAGADAAAAGSLGGGASIGGGAALSASELATLGGTVASPLAASAGATSSVAGTGSVPAAGSALTALKPAAATSAGSMFRDAIDLVADAATAAQTIQQIKDSQGTATIVGSGLATTARPSMVAGVSDSNMLIVGIGAALLLAVVLTSGNGKQK